MKTYWRLILLFFLPLFVFPQAENKRVYTNSNILEVYVNSKEYVHEKNNLDPGWGFEFNSFHGIFILKKFVLSAGIGINFNFNESYQSLPVTAELKYHLYDYGYNSPYVLLNTGRNIKIGNFLPGKTAKLGLGYNFESDYGFQYIVEVFKKSKTYFRSKEQGNNYPANGLGISIGVNF